MQGYVDIQVNGYGGTSYNRSDMTAEKLHDSCQRLKAAGVAGILATITSEQPEVMIRNLSNVVQLRKKDPLAQEIIWGIHIEGPYMSPEDGYRGAHPRAAMKPTNMDVIAQFHDVCEGLLRILTLAPEMDPNNQATKWLSSRDVTVSGGHSNATMDQLKAAVDAGLSMWTHLGNGAPMQMHRHDNIIQRVLSLTDQITICFIGDGVHVPLFTLKNYLKAANLNNTIVVTDAVWPAGLGPGKFNMGHWGEITIGEDLAIWAPDKSHFLGSALTMPQCHANLKKIGIPEETIQNLLIHHPAKIAKGPAS
jgi:N-acetylglucosamine-6-phosphate deacetylase